MEKPHFQRHLLTTAAMVPIALATCFWGLSAVLASLVIDGNDGGFRHWLDSEIVLLWMLPTLFYVVASLLLASLLRDARPAPWLSGFGLACSIATSIIAPPRSQLMAEATWSDHL